MPQKSSDKITIIGGGLAGCFFATLLANRGYKVELFEKRADRAMIIVSHELHNIKDYCTKTAVLDKGKLTLFDDINESLGVYNSL